MNHKDLKAFRHMIGFSQQDMADALGYGRRNYQEMERGAFEIRNGTGLACAALALGITHYDADMVRQQWERTQKNRKGK